MCDVSGCPREAVAFVDVSFPADATHDPSTEDRDRPQDVPAQRVGLCIAHAAEHGLTQPLNIGHAVKGQKAKGRFPGKHAFAADWSWAVG